MVGAEILATIGAWLAKWEISVGCAPAPGNLPSLAASRGDAIGGASFLHCWQGVVRGAWPGFARSFCLSEDISAFDSARAAGRTLEDRLQYASLLVHGELDSRGSCPTGSLADSYTPP